MDSNQRILVVDDNESVQVDFTRLLIESEKNSTLDELAALVFDDVEPTSTSRASGFEVRCASQGQQALEMVQSATREGRPYALAFVDMRMPPGWDGLTTIKKLWEVDSHIEVVVCSAYSDYAWSDVAEALGESDQLLFLKKPFDGTEVVQLAHTLTRKWSLQRAREQRLDQLQSLIDQRTLEFQRVNHLLEQRNGELQDIARSVQETLNPPPEPIALGAMRLAGYCETCDECGGDWWTYQELADGRVLVVMGDVAGHGIAATMVASAACGSVGTMVEYSGVLTPAQVLYTLDRIVQVMGKGRFWMTCAVMLFDMRNGTVSYANAAHTLPFLLRHEGSRSELRSLVVRGNPLGSRTSYFPEKQLSLAEGDLFLLFSDGVTQCRNKDGVVFGERRLRPLLEEAQVYRGDDAAFLLRDRLLCSLRTFRDGEPMEDDITIVACHYRGDWPV